jgi:hypothetical protein
MKIENNHNALQLILMNAKLLRNFSWECKMIVRIEIIKLGLNHSAGKSIFQFLKMTNCFKLTDFK